MTSTPLPGWQWQAPVAPRARTAASPSWREYRGESGDGTASDYHGGGALGAIENRRILRDAERACCEIWDA